VSDLPPPAIYTTAAGAELLARTIRAESEGEPFDGQVAVGWVAVTRARLTKADPLRFSWWAKGPGDDLISRVCLSPQQFSCWNCLDLDEPIPKLSGAESRSHRIARAAADLVLLGVAANPMPGATHYHTAAQPNGTNVWPPKWAASLVKLGQIGGHVFYREK
jgi:spore germination cell wall hydrolase CwlJ-like protein